MSRAERLTAINIAVIWGLLDNYYKHQKMLKLANDLLQEYCNNINVKEQDMLNSVLDIIEKFGTEQNFNTSPQFILVVADNLCQECLRFSKNSYRISLWNELLNMIIEDQNYKHVDYNDCDSGSSLVDYLIKEVRKYA